MGNVLTISEAAALANHAERGALSSLGNILRSLSEGAVYDTYAGNPDSNLTPKSKGAWCLDTTNSIWYRAKGTENTDWVSIGEHGLTAAELTVLNVVAGTGAVSKALVLDASGDVSVPGSIAFDSNTTITAFAGGGVGSATQLTGQINHVTTCATEFDSVILEGALSGRVTIVKNSGAATCSVFPATSDAINALAADLSIDIPPGGMEIFWPIDATTWETNEVHYINAPTTQRGGFGIKAIDNAANHDVILTNASHGQTSVHSIPDPGGATGTIMLLEGAQTVVGVQTIANPALAAEHGAGAIGTAVAPATRRWTENGVIVTQITFDLTGLTSVATANDAIGLSAGGNAYIGRNVVATNGIIFKTEFSCLETPVGGDNDVNVVANASGTIAYDGAAGTTYLAADAGDLTIGQTVQNLVPAVTANDYYYLTAGTGDTAVIYTAGMYVLTTYGHAALA